jgi:hypothetical protein
MIGACFAVVRTAFRVFGSVQVAKVLELVVGLHVTVDAWALPVSRLKRSMLWALLGDFDFSVDFG